MGLDTLFVELSLILTEISIEIFFSVMAVETGPKPHFKLDKIAGMHVIISEMVLLEYGTNKTWVKSYR